MARRHPDREAVVSRLEELKVHSSGSGGRVSVLALARSVGMSNTTFRRVFPDLVAEVTALEAPPGHGQVVAERTVVTLEKVRKRNRDLEENLNLAVAAIQRLTLENARLRTELESALSVVSFDPLRRKIPKSPD